MGVIQVPLVIIVENLVGLADFFELFVCRFSLVFRYLIRVVL
jgi:hypothetical protein